MSEHTFTISVYHIKCGILVLEGLFAVLCVIIMARRVKKWAADRKARSNYFAEQKNRAEREEGTAYAKRQKKLKEDQIRTERAVLEKMLPPSWLDAYDTCEAVGSFRERKIWLKEWAGVRKRLLTACQPFPRLPMPAIQKFAAMVAQSEYNDNYINALDRLSPFLALSPDDSESKREAIAIPAGLVQISGHDPAYRYRCGRILLHPNETVEFRQKDGKRILFVAHDNEVTVCISTGLTECRNRLEINRDVTVSHAFTVKAIKPIESKSHEQTVEQMSKSPKENSPVVKCDDDNPSNIARYFKKMHLDPLWREGPSQETENTVRDA